MGGKKKTKWRKLPLGELTQGSARGTTVSGSLREQTEDGPHENGYDSRSDEHQWKEARHTGYYAQGPPHFYSTSQGQDDASQEETAETDEKSGIFFNGFWIPESDLDQFNMVNASPFEPLFRQVPVFLCPPVMPYCSAPYPHFRSPYQSDGPLFSSFCIPSDQHYYYYFTRPRTVSYEDEQPFDGEEENNIQTVVNSDTNQKDQAPQQEPNSDDGETHPAPVLLEATRDTAHPYSGYNFGEPLYSVPVYQLLPPPPQRVVPGNSWSSAQTQRKRRRRRKEYNADYAIIPAPKSQASTRSTTVKCDLDVTGDKTTSNNESRNQLKGNDSHSVSGTASSSSREETKQNDCVLNNQGSDDADPSCLCQQEITNQDERNLTEDTASPTLKEFPEQILKKVRCKIIDSPASELCSVSTYEKEDVLIAEIVSDLIEKVVTECPHLQKGENKSIIFDACQLTQKEAGNNRSPRNLPHCDDSSQCVKSHSIAKDEVTKNCVHFNENFVISVEFENESAAVEMENILRKNSSADLPEVHKKVQDELGIENTGSYSSAKNLFSTKEITDESFVQKENWKNLTHGRPVKLAINEEENKFFDVTLLHEEGEDVVPNRREESHTQNERETSKNVTRDEENVEDNEQHKFQEDALTSVEQNDIQYHNEIEKNQSDCKAKAEVKSNLDCRTNVSGTEDYSIENGGTKESNMDKNGHDSLDSITSNDSLRDREKQLSDSHRSSPHSFLSYATNSEALIRETELELSKIQHLTSRPPLQANQSIYKFAFDENLTDQSETEDTMTPIPLEESNDYRIDLETEDAAVSAEMRQDIQRSEIVVHEGDSASEAGSEDVELLPHRYESQGGEKHLYVNKLSLAVELLRTHEQLPYDEEFKRVVEDEGENVQHSGKEVVVSRSNKVANITSGTVNLGFIGDMSPKVHTSFGIHAPLDKNVLPVVENSPGSIRNPQETPQGQHRHSHISTADSGVQSEDSGDEMGEEAKENYGRLGFTECEDQELWNPTDDATMGYRRFGVQARQRFNIFAPRAGGLNPCFCCVIM